MNLGKISDTVYRRAIAKQMKISETDMVLEEKTVFGSDKKLGIYAIAGVVNRLKVQQVEGYSIYIKISLPKFAYESRLKSMVKHIADVCEVQQIEIQYIDAQVSPVITSSLVQVIGFGKRITPSNEVIPKQELDIVLTKHVGLEGTSRLLSERTEILEKRFISSFLQGIRQKEGLFCDREIEIATKQGAAYFSVLGEGGIYAALWNMAETLDVGLAIAGDKISIYQETIEICEYFHLNPYQLASEGNMLILAQEGVNLQKELRKNNIHATVIGKTTMEKQRIIRREGDMRFLDKPVPDELLKIFEN